MLRCVRALAECLCLFSHGEDTSEAKLWSVLHIHLFPRFLYKCPLWAMALAWGTWVQLPPWPPRADERSYHLASRWDTGAWKWSNWDTRQNVHFSGSVEVDGMNIMFPCNGVHAGKQGRLQQKRGRSPLGQPGVIPSCASLEARRNRVGEGRWEGHGSSLGEMLGRCSI